MPDPTPTAAQIGTARDALTLVSLTWSGDLDAAEALVTSLIATPDELPGVLAGLAGLVAQALGTDPDVAPEVFVAACAALLDHAESGES